MLKLEPNPLIGFQVTVSKSNQPPNFSQGWKKVNFMCWLNTTFCVEGPYQKPRPNVINIIRTLLHCMEWFKSGLPNFVVVVRAQKPYLVQVDQTKSHIRNNPKIPLYCFEWPESKNAWNSWDHIHLSWACGQYFAYPFMHEKALCKMGAAISHNRLKSHSCDHFGEKLGLF